MTTSRPCGPLNISWSACLRVFRATFILGIAAAALEREESDLSKRLIGMTTGPSEHARLTCEASLMGVAAAKNSAEILSILLDRAMSAGTQDQYGTSPLHVAAAHNCKEAAELIVSRGVDISMNATTTCGVTGCAFRRF